VERHLDRREGEVVVRGGVPGTRPETGYLTARPVALAYFSMSARSQHPTSSQLARRHGRCRSSARTGQPAQRYACPALRPFFSAAAVTSWAVLGKGYRV
jgi:hypothetical protein